MRLHTASILKGTLFSFILLYKIWLFSQRILMKWEIYNYTHNYRHKHIINGITSESLQVQILHSIKLINLLWTFPEIRVRRQLLYQSIFLWNVKLILIRAVDVVRWSKKKQKARSLQVGGCLHIIRWDRGIWFSVFALRWWRAGLF